MKQPSNNCSTRILLHNPAIIPHRLYPKNMGISIIVTGPPCLRRCTIKHCGIGVNTPGRDYPVWCGVMLCVCAGGGMIGLTNNSESDYNAKGQGSVSGPFLHTPSCVSIPRWLRSNNNSTSICTTIIWSKQGKLAVKYLVADEWTRIS